jgi:hypothetical protein
MKRLRTALTIAVWAAGLALFASTTRPFPTVELCAAILLALLAGVLSLSTWAKATQVARYLVWVNAIAGLVWAMAFAPDMFAGAWLTGVCAFGVIVSAERALWPPARS